MSRDLALRRVLPFLIVLFALWRMLRKRAKDMSMHINSADSRMKQIVSNCPSLSVPYQAPWWCLNSWINTAAALMQERKDAIACPDLRRDTITRPDGGEVSVDWYPSGNLPDEAPLLGIL